MCLFKSKSHWFSPCSDKLHLELPLTFSVKEPRCSDTIWRYIYFLGVVMNTYSPCCSGVDHFRLLGSTFSWLSCRDHMQKNCKGKVLTPRLRAESIVSV